MLVEHNGCRSVLFLGGFDKTMDSVHKAIRLLLDKGRHRNRINSKQLDCSKIIRIMTTDHGEEEIKRFWDKYIVDILGERQLWAPLQSLQCQLRGSLLMNLEHLLLYAFLP